MTNKEKAIMKKMLDEAICVKSEAVAMWYTYTSDNKENKQLDKLISKNWHEATGRIDILCAFLGINPTYINNKMSDSVYDYCRRIENGIASSCYKEYITE